MSLDIKKLKSQVTAEVDRRRDELVALSLRIHDNPEVRYEEFKAFGWITDYLENNGFTLERGICDLPTAFRATYGSGRPTIAFLAEYDALPKMGHGCGHNIIAAGSSGAGVAAKLIVDQTGGSVVVLGTPAEEGGVGKALMIKNGAFNDVDAAMLVHPARRNAATIVALACIGLEVEYIGKAAHSAASPHEGINALEAMIQAFNNINSLRQHIKDRARIHGIITNGGEAENVVPAYSSGKFLIRAEDSQYLDKLCIRVLNCFEAAALASGAQLKYKWEEARYDPMNSNMALAELFTGNYDILGRSLDPPDPTKGFGSTDMGNVSTVVPAIHPSISIAPMDVLIHSPEFAVAAASDVGHQGLIDAAKAMAMTAADLLADERNMEAVKDGFSTPQA
ncbi:MAG: M20 family metallopeptidase [Deltaproteobacteria bacterium]|nr:M20 family metallopeptidase [Deltaproteobacteria bacterium]